MKNLYGYDTIKILSNFYRLSFESLIHNKNLNRGNLYINIEKRNEDEKSL